MPYRAAPEIVECPLGDGVALLDSRSGASFTLNRTGALIWAQAQAASSRADFVAALRRACPDAPATLEADVGGLVDQLVAAGLLVDAG